MLVARKLLGAADHVAQRRHLQNAGRGAGHALAAALVFRLGAAARWPDGAAAMTLAVDAGVAAAAAVIMTSYLMRLVSVMPSSRAPC